MEKVKFDGWFNTPENQKMTIEELELEKVKNYNNEVGKLEGHYCPKCKNKGWIQFYINGCICSERCDCWAIRQNKRMVEDSGLVDKVNKCTFENYKATTEWQQHLRNKAIAFTKEPKGWFAILGQSGAGKTHLCVAICSELMLKGMPVKYMVWSDDNNRLKQMTLDNEYQKEVEQYKTMPVLYIDDFLKGKITDADLRLAFEILNYRYNQEDLITIITSELGLADIPDEALAGRIKEKCGANLFKLAGKDKNYRMKGDK